MGERTEYNLEKALSLYDEQRHANGAFRALYQLFVLHCVVDVDKATQDNTKLQARLCEIQDPYLLMLYYQLLGDTLEHKNDWAGALTAYQKALNSFNNVPNIKNAVHKYPFLKSCLEKLEGAIHWCQAKLPDSDLYCFNKKYLSGSPLKLALQIYQNHIESEIEHFFQRVGNYRVEDKVLFLLKTLSCWQYTKNALNVTKYKQKLAYTLNNFSMADMPVEIIALWSEYQANECKLKEGAVDSKVAHLNEAIELYQEKELFEDAFRCQLLMMEAHFWLKSNRPEDFSYLAHEATKAALEKRFSYIEEVGSELRYHYLMGCYYSDTQNYDLALIHFNEFELRWTPDLNHVTRHQEYEKTLEKNRQICIKGLLRLTTPEYNEVSGLKVKRQPDSGEYCLQSEQNPKLELYQFSKQINHPQSPAGLDSTKGARSDSDSLWREFDKSLKFT